jgi:ABC-type branched-subunit amino acid transport system ATPase component
MLEIDSLSKRFGGLVAVDDVSTHIEAGKINAIIGPNGAGKTTFFNLISGTHLQRPGRDKAGRRSDGAARRRAHISIHRAVRPGQRAR